MSNQKYEAVVICYGKGVTRLASYLGNKGIDVAVIAQSKAMYGSDQCSVDGNADWCII